MIEFEEDVADAGAVEPRALNFVETVAARNVGGGRGDWVVGEDVGGVAAGEDDEVTGGFV